MSQDQVKTQVTSIAEEEARTGEQVLPPMTDLQMIQYASQALVSDLTRLERVLKGMKAKHITQAVIGGMDFPKDNLPVNWVDKTGKPRSGYEPVIEAFMLMQRLFNHRFVITQKYVLDTAKHLKEQKAKVSSQSDDKVSDSNEQSSTQETTNE